MLLAVPMILGTIALVPYLGTDRLFDKFRPTVEILEWQLIGDLLKFSSWTMAFALLARCGSSVYFLTESIGGVAILVTTWLAVRWLGLSGLGISFVATYIIYYVAVWIIIRRQIPTFLDGVEQEDDAGRRGGSSSCENSSLHEICEFQDPCRVGTCNGFRDTQPHHHLEGIQATR